MQKRTFLKLSSALLTAPLIKPFKPFMPTQRLKNWAGNITYSTSQLAMPRSLAEAIDVVKKHPRLKALGTRHCFNQIADSRDQFISLREMNKVVSIDEKNKTVTLESGMSYGQLCPILEQKGFALHNLASLPHISVAGACTTATHGSGVHNGNLSTAVRAVTFIKANGEVHTLSKEKDGEAFNAAVVGLGGIGVITEVTLALEPTYQVKQHVYEKLPLSELEKNFDAVLSAGYSVSLFTDWQSDFINEVWIKSKVGAVEQAFGPNFFGAKAATRNLHPIAELDAENCTAQMGVAGPWYERLPHFKMGFTPSSGVELQAEYFVPRRHGWEAFMAVQRLGKQIGPHLLISEIRTIDADDFWMSPAYRQPSMAIHFTLKQDWPAVQQLLPKIEQALSPWKPRPHWGKLFTLPAAELRQRYEKFDAFKNMLKEYDPAGKFRNDFLEKYV